MADKNCTAESLGDEPFQFYSKHPEINVVVCEDRRKGMNIILKNLSKNIRYYFLRKKGSPTIIKKRFLDATIDMKDEDALLKIQHIINGVRPHKDEPKVISIIPTKSGYHLITERFDVMEFGKYFLGGDVPDIQKKNPTLLYLPDSLHQDQEMEHLKDVNFIGGLTMPSEPNEWWSKIDK